MGNEANVPARAGHNVHSPSALGRRVLCPASGDLEAQAVALTSEDAEDGIRDHGLAAGTGPLPDDLDDDSRAAILTARDYGERWCRGADEVLVEQRMALWLDGVPITDGTPDRVAVWRRHDLSRVLDWKFGRAALYQTTVEWQMRAYAGMAMQATGTKRCEVRVFQPRTDTDLYGAYGDPDQIAREVWEVIRASRGSTLLVPSAEACRHCSAKTFCPEFRREILDSLPAARDRVDLLSGETLRKALDFASLIDPWVVEVKEHAKRLLRAGGEIPGWYLGGRNVRKIKDREKVLEAVKAVLTADEVLSCARLSLSQVEDAYARKMVDSGAADTIVAAKDRLAKELAGAIEEERQEFAKRKAVK